MTLKMSALVGIQPTKAPSGTGVPASTPAQLIPRVLNLACCLMNS